MCAWCCRIIQNHGQKSCFIQEPVTHIHGAKAAHFTEIQCLKIHDMQSSLGFCLGPFEEEERAEPAKAVVQYKATLASLSSKLQGRPPDPMRLTYHSIPLDLLTKNHSRCAKNYHIQIIPPWERQLTKQLHLELHTSAMNFPSKT